MTIIELAIASGMTYYGMNKDHARFIHHLDKFAELVAAQEREECAKVCDDYDIKYDVNTCDTAEGIALEIRARGTT